ncbi:T9SS type B sorting domain-containing protein [Lacinutrix sp. Hel_I_90]|uniref:T9SS type B sorting domain-containing protein n=1 Tax=Lacinutrix sp. Hel_I_90 TaxID=1249999 RepID=UPI0005CA9C0C|nr:T9SS type B sorting domain-containing protein [Lacinutrix sp. Hel_I_90]
MKNLLFTCCVLFTVVVNAQKEASNWYFGNNAGVYFDTDAGTVTPLNNGSLSTEEGCTSISDTDGNLLFYTDGRTVYNSFHNIMLNGSGLKGDASSTQSALIVPKPNDDTIYYIFTVDTPALDNIDTGFNYFEVDMTLDGGLGGVVNNNGTNLLQNTSEKLSAVLKDCESQDIWVITFGDISGGENNNTFFAYRVTDTGVNPTPVRSTFNLNINEIRGYLKFSPSGTQIACANVGQGILLLDFDLETGIASNLNTITPNLTSPNGSPQLAYGVEFSPNNQLLYISTYFTTGGNNNDPNSQYGALLQYNLNATNIDASEIVIDERQTYRGGLQLGPDGKLYRAMSESYSDGSPFLSVVNNPNGIGVNCNYQHNAIALTGDSRQGLPPFITSFFSENIDIIQNGTSSINLALCTGDVYTLMAEDITDAVYTWYMDGVLLSESDFDLDITAPGFYEVFIELIGEGCGSLEGEANVIYYDIPVANQPSDINVCSDDETATFDFTVQTAAIIGVQDPTEVSVKYYPSLQNLMDNQNIILGAYQNISNPQTIYAKIDNVNNIRCYDITSFDITVFVNPIINNTIDIVGCDADANPMDGFTTLTLSDYSAVILGSQDPMQFSVTYHGTSADAESGTGALQNNYTNQTAFTDSIFIRIENNANTTCYTTDSINIVINPIPEVFDADIYQCDDQEMIDGFTTFNLTEANSDLTGNATDRSTQFFLTQNDAQNNTNAINGNAYNNVSNPETLYVRVTNDITGCFNFTTLTLETSDTQINDYIATPVCDELGSEDGINTFNLDDFSSDILNGLPAGLTINYYETPNDALLENNALSTAFENTVPYSQIIYVRVENDNACYGINEVLLTITPLPDLEDDETIFYCLNEFPQTITLDAGLNDTNSGNYSLNWSTSEVSQTIAINTTGTYTVTVTNNDTLCEKTRTILVEPSNIATVENIEVIDGSLNNNQITVLTSGEGNYLYALIDAEGIQSSFQESNVFSQLQPGIYSIVVRDIKNNCGITNDMVSVIGFPLYFTPNNDGQNDTWQVYGVSRTFQANSEILIFDRYGKLLTQINPSGQGWDGTFNGNPMPTNDYWFTVKLQDGRTYRDHFTLKR